MSDVTQVYLAFRFVCYVLNSITKGKKNLKDGDRLRMLVF